MDSDKMTLDGVDVSAYQPHIDFSLAKASGRCEFVYAKASEGAGYVDDQFIRNHDQCKALGIPFGAYHFLRFGIDPILQAEHFLDCANGRYGQLLPMVDVEGGGQDGIHDLPTLIHRLASFNAYVEHALGCKVLIYSDYGDWNGMMQGTSAFSGHLFWVAEYNKDPEPTLPNGFNDWVIWQYSSSGSIPGIRGAVDLDRTKDPDLKRITR